jgi:hypothetical protein
MVMVLVEFKEESINRVGTASRLELVDADASDLDVLATFAWAQQGVGMWPHISRITWMDHKAPGQPVHELPNNILREGVTPEQFLNEGRF